LRLLEGGLQPFSSPVRQADLVVLMRVAAGREEPGMSALRMIPNDRGAPPPRLAVLTPRRMPSGEIPPIGRPDRPPPPSTRPCSRRSRRPLTIRTGFTIPVGHVEGTIEEVGGAIAQADADAAGAARPGPAVPFRPRVTCFTSTATSTRSPARGRWRWSRPSSPRTWMRSGARRWSKRGNCGERTPGIEGCRTLSTIS
jgi:hypothetical protein